MISYVKGAVLDVMKIAGLLKQLGEGHIFYEVDHGAKAPSCHRDAVDQGNSMEKADFSPSDTIDECFDEWILWVDENRVIHP
ncbi:MAG: hypothetical protein VX589_02705 [Myxococcota bacterium]|nr:hypothetical protein [Myxococcota bacterium]